MTVKIHRADELGETYRRRIAAVLVRGFAEDFAYFSTDSERLADAFEHMLLLDRFYVALVDGEPAAVASLTRGEEECFAPRWAPMRRHLGPIHGTITYLVVRSEFLGTPEAEPGLAEIGFVATAPTHRGQGVATALIRHLLALPGTEAFLLRDIKDNNAPALALYEKLGFSRSSTRPVRSPGRAGFTEYVSMRRPGPGA